MDRINGGEYHAQEEKSEWHDYQIHDHYRIAKIAPRCGSDFVFKRGDFRDW